MPHQPPCPTPPAQGPCSRLDKAAIAVAFLVPLLVTALTAAGQGSDDDMAVLRSLSRLITAPELVRSLVDAVQHLPDPMRLRYTVRLDTAYNYPLYSLLLRMLDLLPTQSAYTTSILLHTLLKASALALFFATARRVLGCTMHGLAWALVLSLDIAVLPWGLSLQPLGVFGMIWLQPPLRCTGLIAFAALVVLYGARPPDGMRSPGSRLAAWAIAAFAASLNLGFSLLFVPTLLMLLPRFAAIPDRYSGKRLTALYLGASTSATVVAVLLMRTLIPEHTSFDPRRALLWIAWQGIMACLCLLWEHHRTTLRNAPARTLGDRLLLPLLVHAVLVSSIILLKLHGTLLAEGFGPTLFYEAAIRSSGVASTLFLLQAGLLLHTMRIPWKNVLGTALLLPALALPVRHGTAWTGNAQEITNPQRLTATLAGRSPSEALFKDERLFFHALANDLARPGGTAIVKDFCARAPHEQAGQ